MGTEGFQSQDKEHLRDRKSPEILASGAEDSAKRLSLGAVARLFESLHVSVGSETGEEAPNKKRRVEPFSGFAQSTADVTSHAETEVTRAIQDLLPALLAKTTLTQEDQDAVVRAAAERDFSGISTDNPEAMKAALLSCLLAERSRTDITVHALRSLSPENLAHLGMSSEVRDALAEALPQLTASNAEYMRAMIRGMDGADRSEIPVDAFREWKRLGKAVDAMRTQLESSTFVTEQGQVGSDFLAYLELIKNSLEVYDVQTNSPYTKEKRDELVEAARLAFVGFYKAHPDFPLILLPASDTYVNQGFSEERQDKADLGFDPEMRIVWQAPQERAKAELLENIRLPFADALVQKYPHLLTAQDVQEIQNTRVIIGQDIAAAGINMKYHAPAQRGEQTTFLFENTQKAEYNLPALDKIKKMVPEEFHSLLDGQDFSDVLNNLVICHELVHEIYPSESEFVKTIQEVNELLKETKSDTLARVVFQQLFAEKAQEKFREATTVMLNLAMIADDLQTLSNSSKTDESSAYWTGTVTRLTLLMQRGVIVQSDHGFTIDISLLSQDIGEIYSNYGEIILSSYDQAKQGNNSESLNTAQQLSNVDATPEIEALNEFLSK